MRRGLVPAVQAMVEHLHRQIRMSLAEAEKYEELAEIRRLYAQELEELLMEYLA
ncbi:MAG TPA: hypothetical protein VF202_15890 [Trueperaceae bacterium]